MPCTPMRNEGPFSDNETNPSLGATTVICRDVLPGTPLGDMARVIGAADDPVLEFQRTNLHRLEEHILRLGPIIAAPNVMVVVCSLIFYPFAGLGTKRASVGGPLRKCIIEYYIMVSDNAIVIIALWRLTKKFKASL